MGATVWDQNRLAAEVERLARRALPYDERHRELARSSRRLTPLHASCWHLLDADTMLPTIADHAGDRCFLRHATCDPVFRMWCSNGGRIGEDP